MVSGLLPATAGSVTFAGQDVTSWQPHRRASAGLVLAPESRGVFPGLTVEENLAIRLRSAAERAAVYERFPALGRRRGINAGSLSGGEQQMLTLAPLLADPPTVLIADEPTLGLAPVIAAEVIEVFQELRSKGVTLLLVEERARDILAVADRVAIIELGRLVWSGQRGSLEAARLVNAYLGRSAPPTDGAERRQPGPLSGRPGVLHTRSRGGTYVPPLDESRCLLASWRGLRGHRCDRAGPPSGKGPCAGSAPGGRSG